MVSPSSPFTMMQLLIMGQLMQASDSRSSEDYTDYVILGKNSVWSGDCNSTQFQAS